jgi:hypothetical protein
MKYAPIISLHYKRPQHSLRVLESLAANEGAQQSELFIFSDAPKSEADEEGVNAVRKAIKSRRWCGKVNISERNQNFGCFKNAIASIGEICNFRDRFIYTEDDTLLAPYFLNYMNNALDAYQDHPSVMHISGYIWPIKIELPETFFLKIPNIWTFASWKRAWQYYPQIDGAALLAEIQNRHLESDFTFNGSRRWLEALQEEINGKQDCWDIYWAAFVYLNGLTLYPGKSFVQNIGFDGSGLHFDFVTSAYNVKLSNYRIHRFTDDFSENLDIKAELEQYFQSIVPRRGSLWERGTYRVQKTLRKAFKRYHELTTLTQ